MKDRRILMVSDGIFLCHVCLYETAHTRDFFGKLDGHMLWYITRTFVIIEVVTRMAAGHL